MTQCEVDEMIKIRLKGAGEATFKNGKWACEVESVEQLLNTIVKTADYSAADPFPELTIAQLAIDDLGGVVLEQTREDDFDEERKY